MLISFIIPAYNAAATIGRTLDSVFGIPLPEGLEAEAMVIDDGSTDGKDLAAIVARYPGARLFIHTGNRGMCAARNTGITGSRGDIVTILDSDDTLVEAWPDVLLRIMKEWPDTTRICYVACRTPDGRMTVQDKDYRGILTLDDILNEHHAGEYIPLFRGPYVREKCYTDLGLRKSCGIVSYIGFALDGPFWICPEVLRIYDDRSTGSVSSNWTSPKKAAETARCYQELFRIYGDLYRTRAPRAGRRKQLKLAVYLRLAGLPGAWNAWKKGAGPDVPRETLGALLVLLLGPRAGAWLSVTVKRIGWIKQYG